MESPWFQRLVQLATVASFGSGNGGVGVGWKYQAAKRLSIPKSSLGNWVRAARSGKLGKVGQGQQLLTETEMELARLRRELAEVKLERDLLKSLS